MYTCSECNITQNSLWTQWNEFIVTFGTSKVERTLNYFATFKIYLDAPENSANWFDVVDITLETLELNSNV